MKNSLITGKQNGIFGRITHQEFENSISTYGSSPSGQSASIEKSFKFPVRHLWSRFDPIQTKVGLFTPEKRPSSGLQRVVKMFKRFLPLAFVKKFMQ